jgi:hypothetical protein
MEAARGSGVPSTEVVLDYIGRVHEAFVSNRTTTSRIMTFHVLVSVLVIAIAGGAAVGQKFSFGSNDFGIEPWAVVLGGVIFLSITPGFLIARMDYNARLGAEIERWYECLAPVLKHRTKKGPFEIPDLLSEAGWASGRFFGGISRDDKGLWGWLRRKVIVAEPDPEPAADTGRGGKIIHRLTRVTDFIGGPITWLVVMVGLPLTAYWFAYRMFVRVGDFGDGWILAGVIVLSVYTLGGTVVAALGVAKRARVVPPPPPCDPTASARAVTD